MCVPMYGYTCMWVQFSQRPEEGIRAPRAAVVNDCEPLDVDAGKWTQIHCRVSICNNFNLLVTNELEHIFIKNIAILKCVYNFTYFCVCVRERGLTRYPKLVTTCVCYHSWFIFSFLKIHTFFHFQELLIPFSLLLMKNPYLLQIFLFDRFLSKFFMAASIIS